jgi:predicted alpha/beta hydrolase family esterase
MKTSETRSCPLPSWAFSLALLLGELAFFVWITRKGVERGIWSDAVGGVLFILLPLVLRAVVCFGSYRASLRTIPSKDRIHRSKLFKFFAIEYAHFCKQTLLQLPFPALWRTKGDRGEHSVDGEVILFQHGYAHSGAVWSRTARELERKGYRVYTIDQPTFAPIDTMADRLALRIQEVLRATGAAKLTLVAHSMGGLIARAYLRRHGGAALARAITIGSPHHGTHHAVLARGTNGQQMRIGSDWLKQLARERINVPFTSIYSVHDTVISPQSSSHLDGVQNIVLHDIGHVSMPSGTATRGVLLDVLKQTDHTRADAGEQPK